MERWGGRDIGRDGRIRAGKTGAWGPADNTLSREKLSIPDRENGGGAWRYL